MFCYSVLCASSMSGVVIVNVDVKNVFSMFISAKWTKWMAEIMCSLDVRLSACVCAQRIDQSDQLIKKRLKLLSSNLTRMFPGTVRTWLLKIFSKGSVCENSLGGDMHSHERLLVYFFLIKTRILTYFILSAYSWKTRERMQTISTGSAF